MKSYRDIYGSIKQIVAEEKGIKGGVSITAGPAIDNFLNRQIESLSTSSQPYISDGLELTASNPPSMTINISAGSGFVNGRMVVLAENKSITLTAEDTIWYVIVNAGAGVSKTLDTSSLLIGKIILSSKSQRIVGSQSLVEGDDGYIHIGVSAASADVISADNPIFAEAVRGSLSTIFAETIFGQLKLSENLTITNATGNMVAKSDGIRFYDQSGRTLAEYLSTRARVGGWDIQPGLLKSVSNTIVLDSALSQIQVGADKGILIDGPKESIGTSDYSSGVMSSTGWNISPTEAVFNNITVRGTFKTAVFTKQTVNALNGIFNISNASVLKIDIGVGDTVITVAENVFANGEIVRLKDGNGLTFNNEWMQITSSGSANGDYWNYTVSRSSPVAWTKGAAVVSFAEVGKGFITLDANDSQGPFIDICSRFALNPQDYSTKVRLGNLGGITDPYLSGIGGYGLYSDNVFLRGKIVVAGGEATHGAQIGSDLLLSDGVTVAGTNDVVTSFGTSADTINVSGVSSTTVKNNATDGKTSYDGTTIFRDTTNAPNGGWSGLTYGMYSNKDGTYTVYLNYTYTQGANLADRLFICFDDDNGGLSDPNYSSAVITIPIDSNSSGVPSRVIIKEVPTARYYRFGHYAGRYTNSGLLVSSITIPTAWMTDVINSRFQARLSGADAPWIDTGSNITVGTALSGTRTEMSSLGFRAFNNLLSGSTETVRISAEDGSVKLGTDINTVAGTFIKVDPVGGSLTIGASGSPASTTIYGTLSIVSGYSNISDKPTSLDTIEAGTGTKLAGIATGATVGATWGVNMTPPERLAYDTVPTGNGLFLTGTNMGYYVGGVWKTYMDSGGNFYLSGAGADSLTWASGVLTVSGDIVASSFRTSTGANDKRIDINYASANEISFFGNNGTGTVEKLASIGINTGAIDTIVGSFGSINSTLTGVESLGNKVGATIYGYNVKTGSVSNIVTGITGYVPNDPIMSSNSRSAGIGVYGESVYGVGGKFYGGCGSITLTSSVTSYSGLSATAPLYTLTRVNGLLYDNQNTGFWRAMPVGIFGSVDGTTTVPNSSPKRGVGFTSTRNSTGRYTITFSNAFAAIPVVTATLEQSGVDDVLTIGVITDSAASFRVFVQSGSGVEYDRDFNFFAIAV